jgi:glycerol-3-phosphate O-acyltransferase
MSGVAWGAVGLTALIVYTILYEFVRDRVVRVLTRRWRRSLAVELREHGGTLERHRFTHKQLVRLELLGDIEIGQAILQRATETGRNAEEIREEVEEYIDEIVPFFNLLSFTKFAVSLGKFAIQLAYDVDVKARGLERIQNLSGNASVVFVFNHRSSADFILANTLLSRHIAISFAVGEWARVWPLDALARSFGSYFVRRGFPDPLYHKVLERYLQSITRGGMTQGIFLEGGLTRDGNLRPPKIGVLSSILGTHRDPEFDREILLVPVGLNYDRVLEDFSLLAEARGIHRYRHLLFRPVSLLVVLAGFIRLSTVTLLRGLGGRWSRLGRASIAFGEPVSATRWLEGRPDFWKKSWEERKSEMKEFAEGLMRRIGEQIPVTPVPLVALALEREGRSVGVRDLMVRVGSLREALELSGAPISIGEEAVPPSTQRRNLEDIKRRSSLIHEVEKGIDRAAEHARVTRMALEHLRKRRLVRIGKDDYVHVVEKRRDYLRYYASMVAHHLASDERDGEK